MTLALSAAISRLNQPVRSVCWTSCVRSFAVTSLLFVTTGYLLDLYWRQEARHEEWQQDQRFHAALAAPVRILLDDAENCTLFQAVEQLREQVDVPIDMEAKLAEIPIGPGYQVSRDGSGHGIYQGPLDEVLDQLLRSADAAEGVVYRLEKGRIVLRAGAGNASPLLIRAYETPSYSPNQLNLDERDIIYLITTCINPDAWDDIGGPYSARYSPGVVTVAASSECHRQIARMLQQLSRLPAESASLQPVAFLEKGNPDDQSQGPSLLAALDRIGNFEYKEAPLKEVLGNISHRFQIPVVVATKKLEEAAINTEAPVTALMPNVSLRSCLRNMLGDLGLTYMLEPQGMVITTPEDAGSRLVLLLYPATDLLQHNSAGDSERLKEVIMAAVDPDSWDDVGGAGSMDVIGGSCLLIAQTQETHERTLNFLNQLRHIVPQLSHPQPALAGRELTERHIQKLLCGPEILDLEPLPLDEFAKALQAKLGVAVLLANKRLEEAAIDPTATIVCLDAQPQVLWRQLREALELYGLSFLVRDDCVLITTVEDAASRLDREIVDVRDLTILGGRFASEQFLIHLLQRSVELESWEDYGGAASMVSFGDCLLIQHDCLSLFEVREFLSWLRAHRSELSTPAEIESLERQGQKYNQLVALSQSSPDRWQEAYLRFVLNPEMPSARPVQRQVQSMSFGCGGIGGFCGGCF